MALRLYRRHRKECEAGHPEDFKSGEFEEGRRGWKRCGCPIHASGTIRGKFKRQSTGQWEWDAARAVATQWENRRRGASCPPRGRLSRTSQQTRRQRRRPSRKRQKLSFPNAKPEASDGRRWRSTPRTFTNQLNAYAANRGYIRIDQLSVLDMDRFYASWTDGIRSRAKKLERLKSFIQFCKKRNWLTEDIAEDLDAPPGLRSPCPRRHSPMKSCNGSMLPATGLARQRSRDQATGNGVERTQRISFFSRFTLVCESQTSPPLTSPSGSTVTMYSCACTRRETALYLVYRLAGGTLTETREDLRVPDLPLRRSLNMKQLCDIWRNARLSKVFDLAGPLKKTHAASVPAYLRTNSP